MSTYLPGVTDIIPSAQPFDADLNYYANVLSVKQNQYDQNLAKINSVYTSALNNQMLREDNIVRRDEYFKSLEQGLKKAATMDLSVDQNRMQVEKLFDPILEDKHMINDMVFTKKLQSGFSTAEQYRNCTDPDACGGEYWDEGVQALNYAAEDFKMASAHEALNHSAPTFTPYQNVMKKAIKAAKDSGLDISYDSVSGGYIVTNKNGEAMLGKDGKGILPQYLYGLFGNDSKVQSMYATQAYVQRRNFAKSYAAQNNVSEQEAESMYMNDIMGKTLTKINAAKADLDNIQEKAKIDMTAAEIAAKQKGGVIQGDGIQDAYARLQDLINKTQPAADYHKAVENLISTTPNLNDMRAMRNRVDNIVANANFMDTINQAAYTYAMGTSKTEIKADPYALASYNNQLDLNKALTLKQYDHEIWVNQQTQLGNIGNGPGGKGAMRDQINNAMRDKGIKMEDLYQHGITDANLYSKESQAKLAKLGLFNSATPTTGNPFMASDVDGELPKVDTYQDNVNVTNTATSEAVKNTSAYVTNIVKSMQQAYKEAAANPDQQSSIGIRAKILADAKNMFAGTGVDAFGVVMGNATVENLNPQQINKVANSASMFQLKDATSRVYTSGWDDQDVVNMQISNQAALGLIQQRFDYQKDAVNKLKADYDRDLRMENMDPMDHTKVSTTLTASFDQNGNPLSRDKAFLNYAEKMKTRYMNEAREEDSKIKNQNHIPASETKLAQKAVDKMSSDFNSMYDKISSEVKSRTLSIRSKPGSKDIGGAMMSGSTINQDVDGNSPLSNNYVDFKNIMTEMRNNPNRFPYTVQTLDTKNSIQENPVNQQVFSKLMDKVSSGDTKDMNIKTEVQYIPGEEGNNQVAMKVTIDDKTAKELNGLKPSDIVSPEHNTFIVKASPQFNSLGSIVNKLNIPPEDLYLSEDRKSLSVNVPDKGSVSVRNFKGNMYLDIRQYVFNPAQGKMEYVPITSIPLGKDKYTVKQAFQLGTDHLNKVYSYTQESQKEYLNTLADGQATN
jgi:hypothetical protein